MLFLPQLLADPNEDFCRRPVPPGGPHKTIVGYFKFEKFSSENRHLSCTIGKQNISIIWEMSD